MRSATFACVCGVCLNFNFRFCLILKWIRTSSPIVVLGYADCLVARFNKQSLSTFRNYRISVF